MSFERDNKDFWYAIMWLVIGIIVLGGIVGFCIFYFGQIQSGTADYRGGVGQREQTQADPNYRIQNYNYFFQTCNQVIATENQMLVTQQESDFNTPGSISRQNYQAQQSERLSLISDYNARASQVNTAGQWRSDELPRHLDPNRMPTTCGS